MLGGQPTGTVTFLFTDVEGSTRAWEQHAEAMAVALRRHDEILRTAIDAHDGYVFSTAGDAFSAAFARVDDAVAAAVDAQQSLLAEPWPAPIEVRVRMGLHTGEADERGGDYFGPAVNRAARVMGAGHGGQVLLSDLTASLTSGLELVDLGAHLLKSLDTPIRLHQLAIMGGPDVFPPVRSVGATASTIRPARTDLVGRGGEVERVIGLLGEGRAVTLVGAGGSGKTRLALEVGNLLVPSVSGGVFFIDLSKVSDDALVMAAMAEGCGLMLGGSVSADIAVSDFLADREALLVVDNCEHLIDQVADELDRLLAACSGLRLLATSREPLEIDGERALRLAGLGDLEGVELFRRRATGQLADGPVTDDAILEICRRLDGLPLAIELAAARTSVLSVEEIRGHLDDRFTLLTGGRRRTRGRQQTLKATVEWSYDLLGPGEQQALRVLSVMPSTFGLELAAGVLGCSAGVALDLLEGLAARSLVQSDTATDDPHARYRLLETIRVFAGDALSAAAEDASTRARHATTVLQLLGDVGVFATVDQGRLGDDVLVALDWARATGDVRLGCALARVACDVLLTRGVFDRMLSTLEWVVTVDDPSTQAAMCAIATEAGSWTNQLDKVFQWAQKGVDAAPETVGAAECRVRRSVYTAVVDPEDAAQDLRLAQVVLYGSGDPHTLVWLEWAVGCASMWQDDGPAAVAAFRRSLSAAQSSDFWVALPRGALLTILSLLERRHEITEVLESDPGRLRFHTLREVVHTVTAGDAFAMATLGRIDEARRFVAASWDQRGAASIPGADSDLLVALARCAFLEGEHEAAGGMLGEADAASRWSHTAVLQYHLLGDLQGVSDDDWPEWARGEVQDRFFRYRNEDRRGRPARAVEAELKRVGLR